MPLHALPAAASMAGASGLGNFALDGLGFAGDLITSLFGNDDSEDQFALQQYNIQMQERENSINRANATDQFNQMRDIAMENNNYQRWLTENQLAIRSADARNAGLHPLAGLGINPASGPSQNVFGNLAQTTAPRFDGITSSKNMGQDISRAVFKNLTQAQRADTAQRDLDMAYSRAQIDRVNAETELTRTQIARAARESGPAAPTHNPGGKKMPTSKVEIVPVQEKAKSGTGIQAGAPGEIQLTETPSGARAPMPTQEVAEQLEGSWLPRIAYEIRNSVFPNFGDRAQVKGLPNPRPGYHWVWSFTNQAWVEKPRGRSPKGWR